jgi:aminopeptidase N
MRRIFPLSKFLSRHSPSTEAVGYGKALMLDHMLRRKVGDAAYVRGLQRFYRDRRGQRASFDDLARAHSAAANVDLVPMVSQWVNRVGAPELTGRRRTCRRNERIREVGIRFARRVAAGANRRAVRIRRPGRGSNQHGVQQHTITVRDRSTAFELRTETKPLALEVDPEFDVFRFLDARETAPSLGQMFGDSEVLAVLPAKADAATTQALRSMLEFWGGGAQKIRTITDVEAERLPADRAAADLGRDNALAATSFAS